MAILVLVATALLFIVMFLMIHKLDQIHVLVNSRLSAALKEIRDLKDKLGIPYAKEE